MTQIFKKLLENSYFKGYLFFAVDSNENIFPFIVNKVKEGMGVPECTFLPMLYDGQLEIENNEVKYDRKCLKDFNANCLNKSNIRKLLEMENFCLQCFFGDFNTKFIQRNMVLVELESDMKDEKMIQLANNFDKLSFPQGFMQSCYSENLSSYGKDNSRTY